MSTSTNNELLMLACLPNELKMELLWYFTPQFIINELMNLHLFKNLQNQQPFCRTFFKRYICSSHECDISYDIILQLYSDQKNLSAMSAVKTLFRNLVNLPDTILYENLKQAAVHNWDTYLDFLVVDEQQMEKMKFNSILVEAAYYDSHTFLKKLMTDHYYYSIRRHEPWYSISAGITVAILRGHRRIYELLKDLFVGTTFTIETGKMVVDIIPRFVNEQLRGSLGLTNNDYLVTVELLLYALVENKALGQVCHRYAALFGAVATNRLMLSHLSEGHIEWIVNNYGINCKPNINFLLSIGMDKNFLTAEQLKLLEI